MSSPNFLRSLYECNHSQKLLVVIMLDLNVLLMLLSLLAFWTEPQVLFSDSRSNVFCRMVKLDRRRESLKKRRSMQGLGSFLEEQAFMLARVPREFIRSWWLETVYSELYSSNPRLSHCTARAAWNRLSCIVPVKISIAAILCQIHCEQSYIRGSRESCKSHFVIP